MTPEASDVLRRASAHVLVADVGRPALDDGAAHHVFRVLRVRDGDVVTVTDGAGSWRACRASASLLVPDGEVRVEPRRDPRITVAFAIPKHDRPEWIVQKLTEVGVDRIVVLHAERSVVRWSGERATKQMSKLGRTAVEAMQQSRQVWVPDIAGPVAASSVLAEAVVAEPGGRPLATTDHTIAIGPEGGWTDAEVGAARDRVGLGASVLRVETAAIAAGVLAVAAQLR